MAGEEGELPTTIGELGRLMRSLAKEVREDRRSYLALQVWEVEKRALEESRRTMGREIGELRRSLDNVDSEKEAEHKALHDKIADLEVKRQAGIEQARKDRAKVWVAIGLAALGAVLAVVGGVATAALNQVINGGV